MGTNVYANGMEIACKASSGKSVAAFPDVCFTPPQAPPTPPGVPIPYPNNGMASDATDGSKSVTIKGKEVMLKNKSYFKKSTGDEAGNAGKKGVVSSTNTGKVYFTSWSMNVKIEGENVVRHLDMTTHNHGSQPGNSPPWAYMASMDGAEGQPVSDCKEDAKKAKDACKDVTTTADRCKPENKACNDANRCMLVSYNQGKRTSKATSVGCCPGEQPHHLIEAHCFFERGQRKNQSLIPSVKQYNDNFAPCVCAKGPRDKGKHGQYHAFQQGIEAAHHAKKQSWTYAEARDCGLKSHKAVNPQCDEKCTKAQLDAYHKGECGVAENTELRTDPDAATRSRGELNAVQEAALDAEVTAIRNGGGLGGM